MDQQYANSVERDVNGNHAADGAPPPWADAPGGGWDAPPSNTASHSYNAMGSFKVLRVGVDSLYVSYPGDISPGVEVELLERKELAQRRCRQDQARAQWSVGNHIFEVRDKGWGSFPYILADNAFRICLSSGEGRQMPLAYCKLSSEYLAHVGPEAALEELTQVVGELGQASPYPNVSRLDLFADFQTGVDIESWPRQAWVTRARSVNAYAIDNQFTGWTIGAGGPISARLYNKTLELEKSGKWFFLDLWKRAGMDESRPVWRLEFQVMREVLVELKVPDVTRLMQSLGGIWGYATKHWLRLAQTLPGDSNRGRWPTHPLWERLSEIRWRLDDEPL